MSQNPIPSQLLLSLRGLCPIALTLLLWLTQLAQSLFPIGREGFRTPVLVSHSLLSLLDDVPIRTWFPKENLFSFQTATTTMQA